MTAKKEASWLRVGASALWLLAASCAGDLADEAAPHASNGLTKAVHEVTDPSGRITMQIRVCGPEVGTHLEVSCRIEDPDFLLVGGGGSIKYPKYGALLTASEPHTKAPDKIWRVGSKEHVLEEEHELTAYVIGMKLGNIGAENQRKYMLYDYGTSKGNVYYAEAQVPSGYRVLGGGGAVITNTNIEPGLLLTASYPSGPRNWRTEAKDHLLRSESHAVRGWIIGIQDVEIPGFGRLEVQTKDGTYVDTFEKQIGHSGAVVDNGWLAAGGGAQVEWRGLGRMLHTLQPAFTAFAALDKDHAEPDSGRLRTWVIQVRPN